VKVYVHSLAENLLAVAEFPNVVVAWTSYSVAGIDAIVLVDQEMRIMRFEAFWPENIQTIGPTEKAVVAMTVNRFTEMLVMITSDGKAVFRPLPFFNVK
jgi:hypothetical protein